MANQKGSRKQGRGKRSPARASYKSLGKALKNKRIKIAKHKLAHPNDTQEIGTIPSYKTKKQFNLNIKDPKIKQQEILRIQRWNNYLKGAI